MQYGHGLTPSIEGQENLQGEEKDEVFSIGKNSMNKGQRK